MITREQATATLADFEAAGLDGRIPDLARTVVALHDEVERLRAEIAAAQDRAEVMAEALRLAAESAERSNAEVERLRAEVAKLPATVDQTVNLLRLAEASVSLLRADLEQTTTAWAQECAESLRRADERDAARLELRRLRAAEAPGTDDAAFEGTGWAFHPAGWRHASGAVVLSHDAQWRITGSAPHPHTIHDVALDAMRAAVPGSV